MQRRGVRGGNSWYLVLLLLLVFILSYFDRFILSLLIDPIKASLRLNDFQMGLLMGPAFSLVNALAAIPLGWWADRWSRKYILILGIVFWCAMTTASGFATSFAMLFLLRLGLGLGEAVVSPCSVSMIADSFDRERRSRAIGLYMAGPYLGAGLAFLVGGALVAWLDRQGIAHVAGMGPFETWQIVFFAVGLPGLLLAALMLTVREPARTDTAKEAAQAGAARYLLARWRGFAPVIIGATANVALGTLTLWNVPLFHRVWGWDVLSVGAVTGTFYFTAGPIGTALALWFLRRFGQRHSDAALRLLLLGLAITLPASALYPVMPTPYLAVGLMFVAFIGKSMATAGGPAAFALAVPGGIRTRAYAVFNAIVTLIGPLIGPPLIGWLTDRAGDPGALGGVLCLFVVAIGVPAMLAVHAGRGAYRRLIAEPR